MIWREVFSSTRTPVVVFIAVQRPLMASLAVSARTSLGAMARARRLLQLGNGDTSLEDALVESGLTNRHQERHKTVDLLFGLLLHRTEVAVGVLLHDHIGHVPAEHVITVVLD